MDAIIRYTLWQCWINSIGLIFSRLCFKLWYAHLYSLNYIYIYIHISNKFSCAMLNRQSPEGSWKIIVSEIGLVGSTLGFRGLTIQRVAKLVWWFPCSVNVKSGKIQHCWMKFWLVHGGFMYFRNDLSLYVKLEIANCFAPQKCRLQTLSSPSGPAFCQGASSPGGWELISAYCWLEYYDTFGFLFHGLQTPMTTEFWWLAVNCGCLVKYFSAVFFLLKEGSDFRW